MTDHPHRRASDLAVFGWIRSPTVQIVLDVVLLVLLVAAIAQQVQLRHQADGLKSEVQARAQASYRNCGAANESRQALVNVLEAAQAAIRTSDRPPAEKAAAVRFYQSQIDKVTLTDCKVFLPKRGD